MRNRYCLLAEDAPFVEIAAQPLGIGTQIGQSDVAIRPDEVQCGAPKPGSSHVRLAVEHVKGKP